MLQVSLEQARRIALAAQGFARAKPAGRIDRRHLRAAMDLMRVVQLDSVQALERTQYLVFASRLGAYEKAVFDRLAYGDDEWFETWSHEASLVPVVDEPLFRWQKDRVLSGETWRTIGRLLADEGPYIEAVYDEVVDRGPLEARDLSDPRPNKGEWWGSRSLGAWALDALWRTGRLGIRRGRRFEKRFDLIERIVPSEVLTTGTPSEHEALRELLRRSARSLGIGKPAELIDYYRLPKRPARAVLGEMLTDGELTEVEVAGHMGVLLHPEAKRPRRIARSALLSPFDPIVWHRDRARWLFGFDYKLEIYTPAHKRQYGYYVLPFMCDGELVGRVDVKTDRANEELLVRGVWFEPGVDGADKLPSLERELVALASFVGVDAVKMDKISFT